MPNFLTTDRNTLYAQATARLAVYGQEWVLAPDEDACPRSNALDLACGIRELQLIGIAEAGSVQERRAEFLIGYLIERHGLGALPLPAGLLPSVGVSTGGGAVQWSQIIGIPTSLVYGPLQSTNILDFNAAVQALIDASPSGVSAHSSLTGVVIVGRVTEGGVDPASLPNGTAVHFTPALATRLRNMADPFEQPTASIVLSPSGLQESGTVISALGVDGGFTLGSDSAPTQGVYRKNGVDFLVQTTGIGNATTSPNISETTTFSFLVTFPTAGTKSASATITFAPPTFRGTAVSDASNATILGLTKQVGVHGTSLALSFAAGSVGQVYHFAFPNAWGMPTQVKDGNGFDVTSAWLTNHTATYTNGPYSATYRYIRTNVPFAVAPSAQTFTFYW